MRIRFTILCDNYANFGLPVLAEHGFSLLLEAQKPILFDAGKETIIRNSTFFGIDFRKIDTVVVSHGHYDHTEGLYHLIKVGWRGRVVGHPENFSDRYAERKDKMIHVGIPYKKEFLEARGVEFISTRKPFELEKGIVLSGEVPRINDFEVGDESLYIKSGNNYIKDPFLDDQSLFIETEEGILVVLGCAHAGIINILDHARCIFGSNTKFFGIVGGTHLGMCSKDQLKKSIEELRRFSFKFIIPTHCTGILAFCALRDVFFEKIVLGGVGKRVEVGRK